MAANESYPPYLLQKSAKIDSPLILASPHSGSFYPERLFHLSDRKVEEFQKNEDAAVDKLFSFAPACGIPLLSAVYGRAWVDLNRNPLELDPEMFSDPLPPQALTDSKRVKAGLGCVHKILAPNTPIYKSKLLFRIEQKRLFDIHFPYHAALVDLIKKNISRFGYSVLLDIHSMPELPKDQEIKSGTPDFVLGNADGASCAQELTDTVAQCLKSMGYEVTVNLPFAGAYTTRYYGRPDGHSHALQIEIARHLYWNADKYMPLQGFDALWRRMTVLIEHLQRVLPVLPL